MRGLLPLHRLVGIEFLVFPGWILEAGMENGILKNSDDCISKQTVKFLCSSAGIV